MSQHTQTRILGIKRSILAWTDPIVWVLDKSADSILDIGCGQGKVMDMIKKRVNIKKSVGVDIFRPYLAEARKNKTHTKLIFGDARRVKFKDKSFDVVMLSQILEHMPKREAWKLLSSLEKIAIKQILVSAPIGKTPQDEIDGNKYQVHLCYFYPKDFEKRGYKTVPYGWRWLIGHQGLVARTDSDLVKEFFYILNILVVPLYYLFPQSCDYSFVAYKDLSNEK